MPRDARLALRAGGWFAVALTLRAVAVVAHTYALLAGAAEREAARQRAFLAALAAAAT